MKKFCIVHYVVISGLLFNCTGKKEDSRDHVQQDIQSTSNSNYAAFRASEGIEIDGLAKEASWSSALWYPIDQNWVGPNYSPDDFSGRFKMTWDDNYLYVLAEIIDDTLIDIHEDPKEFYWDDDCLEIFVDEDASGGDHQYNHNAFAYHIGLDYTVADIDVDKTPVILTDHITTKRTYDGKSYTWEVAMQIYDDSFDSKIDNQPVLLTEEKVMGFAIAYCDNDNSQERENFIGSEMVEGEDKNRGWIDAGIFGKVKLIQ